VDGEELDWVEIGLGSLLAQALRKLISNALTTIRFMLVFPLFSLQDVLN
jgi:hypothetical protein